MGGCRCSYRTCKTTSDGNTHFFHYPVFDKHRCHQWIANAQRFDLLELKLSQLKNRVVCQHHFQDNMFMNDMKNKLTHNAVPTLDGPFLSVKSLPNAQPIAPSDANATKALQETVKSKEKIEDDTKYFTTREKIATFSVPYNEFLKKCDLEQLNDPDLLKSIGTPRKKQPLYPSRLIVTEPQIDSQANNNIKTNTLQQVQSQSPKKTQGIIEKKNVIILDEQKITDMSSVILPANLKKVSPNYILKKPRRAAVQTKFTSNEAITDLPNIPNEPVENQNIKGFHINNTDLILPNLVDATMALHPSSVRAINAQKPLQIHSEYPNKCLPQIVCVNSVPSATNNSEVHPTVLDVEFIPEVARVPLEHVPASANANNSIKSEVSTSAQKIDPEEGSQYKSRLREVVEKALSRLDEQRLIQLQSKTAHHVHHHQGSSAPFKSRHICKNPKKPNSLTAALLSKVKENSRDIAEIKQLLQEQLNSANGKSVKTVRDKNIEICSSPERRKKYLFKEISQYLSTKLKSDLYEELFINHLVPKTRSRSSARRKASPKYT